MCYPSPGPLCSSYAARNLTEAKCSDLAERRVEESLSLLSARSEYDATPAGIRELLRRIEESRTDGTDSVAYETRLNLGQRKRVTQLEAIDSTDRGDIRHDLMGRKEIIFPARFHKFCDDYATEPDITYDGEEIHRIIEDSFDFINRLSGDEIEAVSGYTSYGAYGSFQLYEYLNSQSSDERLEEIVKNLDSALGKGRRDVPLKLYRGVPERVMHDCGFDWNEIDAYAMHTFPIGSKFVSSAFMSASLALKTAREFCSSGLVLEVLAKTVAPISNVSAWGVQEKEYILPRNTTYRVHNVKKIEDPNIEIRVIVQLKEE